MVYGECQGFNVVWCNRNSETRLNFENHLDCFPFPIRILSYELYYCILHYNDNYVCVESIIFLNTYKYR